MMLQKQPFLFIFCFFSAFPISFAQLCSSINGLGKCSSNVFNCVFQNGFPNYFKANTSTGDCAQDEFCCVSQARPEDGSCAQRCGVSGAARQKSKVSEGIKLDKNYNWAALSSGAQERSSRIVNGSASEKYEFCWQGGVFVVDTDQLQNNSKTAIPIYVGGASLVGQDMALTAAHVLQPFITNANFIIFVAFGFRDIHDVIEIMNPNRTVNLDETPVFRVPNEMAFHSAYNDRTYENNIAIIRFNPVSCEASSLCPICLSPVPTNPFQPWKGTCFTSGWGATANSSVATSLQKLEMILPYPNECIKSFLKLGLKNYELPSTMLCADSVGQRGGTCDRDGGSPLVCQTKYGNWELTGIVGVGINRCRQIAAPTLFTNVGYYYEWIQSYTNGISQNKDDQTTPATTAPSTSPRVTQGTSTSQSENAGQSLFSSISTSTSRTLTGLPTSLFLTPSAPSRFQFSPPKVFLPKPAPPSDQRQKEIQAFFQERTDDGQTSLIPLPLQPASKMPITVQGADIIQRDPKTTSTTAFPGTFAVLLNSNSNKQITNAISDASSGSVKFFMTAGDGMIRKKPIENPELRSGQTPTPKVAVSSQKSTTPVPTTTTLASSSSSPRMTSTFTTSTTTEATTTTAVTSSSSTPLKSSPNSEPTSRRPSTWFAAKNPTQSTTELPVSSNFVTNSGWNKIVFHIRPNQDNPSILSLLRERYKNSKLYTEAPSNTTDPSTTTKTMLSSTLQVKFVAKTTSSTLKLTSTSPTTSTSPPTTVVPPVSSSTQATTKSASSATTARSNPVTVVISGAQLANLQATLNNMLRNETIENRRPIGPSVMM